MSTDAEILGAWRAGDVESGKILFERHFDSLYRFFRNKVDDGVDDLVQETFLALLSGPEFRGEASFRTFVFAIARNALLAQLRKLGRARSDVDIEQISVTDMGTSPSSALVRKREERLLLEALRAIPLDFQITLELYYWEDLAGPELGHVLGVPEGTVRSRLRRAKEALEKKLKELAEDPEVLASTTTNLDVWARRLRDTIYPQKVA